MRLCLTPTEIIHVLSKRDLANNHSAGNKKNTQISLAVTDTGRKKEKKVMKEDKRWPDSTALNIQQLAIHYE